MTTTARTIDRGVDHAGTVSHGLAEVGRALEDQGVASFRSRSSTCSALQTKARQLTPR
jgi:hypothetical protein